MYAAVCIENNSTERTPLQIPLKWVYPEQQGGAGVYLKSQWGHVTLRHEHRGSHPIHLLQGAPQGHAGCASQPV